MKKWNAPEVVKLDIAQTEHNWFGRYSDGGYIGDGILSGHSTNKKPEGNPVVPPTTPVEPVEPEEVLS